MDVEVAQENDAVWVLEQTTPVGKRNTLTLSKSFFRDRKMPEMWERIKELFVATSETEILEAGKTATEELFNKGCEIL